MLEDGGDTGAAADAAVGSEGDGQKGRDVEEEAVEGGNPSFVERAAGDGGVAEENFNLGAGGGGGVEGVERVMAEAGVKREGEEEEEAYVRVTFQGQPVTHRITECSSDPLEG